MQKEKVKYKYMNEKMSSTRNKRKIKCCRCKKNIFFSKDDCYEEDRETYVDCTECGHSNKLKKK